MPAAKANKKPGKTAFRRTCFRTTRRDLILIDMEPLLTEERQRCDKASNELEKAKQNLERFRNDCVPAYLRWLHAEFGERLTRIRELEAKATELDELIEDVEIESLYSGASERIAYQKLERIRAGIRQAAEIRAEQSSAKWEQENLFSNSKESSPEREDEDDSGTTDEFPPELEEFLRFSFDQFFGGSRAFWDEDDQMFENFKKSFQEEVLGKKRSSSNAKQDHDHDADRESFYGHEANFSRRRRKRSRESDSKDLRIKQVYRDIARKLHPDMNSGLSERETELWHEVQAAYEAEDLEQLEALAAMIEGDGSIGYAKIRSISRLRAIFQEFQRKLRATQKALRQAKKDPAWNFDEVQRNPKKLKILGQQIDRDLSGGIGELEADIEFCERKIARWKAKPRSRKRQSRSA